MFSDVLKRINAHETYKRHIDIFHAVTYDNIDGLVAAFVRNQPFDVRDKNGNTVLHLAAKLNRRLLCRAICVYASHLDLWNTKNNEGKQPIELAEDPNIKRDLQSLSTVRSTVDSHHMAYNKHLIEKKIKENSENNQNQKVVLSLDGGGLRVVLQCSILMAIEREIGEPLRNRVHWVAGTSCGGIMASSMSVDTKDSLEDPKDRELPRKLLQPNKAGILNLEHFNHISNQKIIVECSDACGCSDSCPRRRLQQGQKKRLVVFYENEILGFGLRAAEPIKAGEYVTEYVGAVLTPRSNRDPSYDLGIEIVAEGLAIDSRKCGNLARFVAHACEPNAAFIETHSRIFETDPLIPRVSLYALRDIAIGEAVTICYYSRDKLASGKGIKCACRPNCPNHLPKN